MGDSIRFSNFRIGNSSFTCEVTSSKREKTDTLEFSLRPRVSYLDRDAIACTLVTLCGRGYDEIIMDLTVSQACCDELKKFTQADVKVKSNKEGVNLRRYLAEKKRARKDTKYILNFSGGFDSLAAMALLPPEKCALVSVDFGGWFAREAEFFKEFNPYTLQTNFRQLKYDRESWTFMGTGALLYAHHLNATHHISGTILESSTNHLREVPSRSVNIETMPFSTIGLKDIMLMNGLSEVTTAMIMTKFYPEKVGASLVSLAAPRAEKRYRKQILTEIVCERFNHDIDLPECQLPDPKHIKPFGQYFTTDYLTFYELKHRGLEVMSRTVSDIPDEVVEIANNLSLEFYEHLYPKFLKTIPEDIRGYYLSRLEECGIIPFTEKDWEEYEIVRQCLGKYHPDILK